MADEALYEVEFLRPYMRRGGVMPVGSRAIVPAGAIPSITSPDPPYGRVIGPVHPTDVVDSRSTTLTAAEAADHGSPITEGPFSMDEPDASSPEE